MKIEVATKVKFKVTDIVKIELLLCTVGFLTHHPSASAEMKVTAEKKCSIRIEGGEMQVGEKYFVMRANDEGKFKKIAIVLIKKTTGLRSVGSITAGAKHCGTLVGTTVEPMDANGKKNDKYNGPGMPKFEGSVLGGFVTFSSLGIHQAPTQPVPSLKLWSLGMLVEAYPLMYFGTGLAHKGLGVSLRYNRASPVTDIEVNSSDSNPDKKGKQNTVTQEFEFNSVFRLIYAGDKASTEIHPVGFVRKTLVHTLTGGNASRSPLRNVSYQGFMAGVKQRYFVMPNLRLSGAFRFGFGMSGVVDDTTEATTDPDSLLQTSKAKSPSAMGADVGLDYFLNSIKISGGVMYSQYSTSVELQSAELLGVKEAYLNFYTGVGIAL